MASLPSPLLDLVTALSRLPGVGPRSAERIALFAVQADASIARELARALLAARERIAACSRCGSLTEQQPCLICQDGRRDAALVCVVERAVDIISLEKSGTFRGRYHVLGGKISPLNGIGPEDLRIAELDARIESEGIRELIVALPLDVEGDATSYYLARQFRARSVHVSRIAQGLSVGSGLEFADELTLTRAIEGRRAID
jgi:recombination protein RecR